MLKKQIFNTRVIPALEQYESIPYEIIGERIK